MENNDLNEETQVEETQETVTSADQTEENTQGQEETVESLRGQVAKYKAIADRKDKKLQNASIEAEPLKNNTEQSGLSREETIFFAQGGTEETYAIAKKIADNEGISILAAKEDDYFKFQVNKINEEAKVKANTVGASNGSPTSAGHKPKDIASMTREEHIADMQKTVPGLR